MSRHAWHVLGGPMAGVDQQHAATADGLVPQILRPVPVLTVVSLALGVVAVWAAVVHQALPVVLAAAGRAVAATPPSVHLARRR